MYIQRINFDPVGGDNATTAFRKLDLSIGEISGAIDGDGSTGSGIGNRLAAAERTMAGLGSASTRNVGSTSGTVAAGDDARFAANAGAAADAMAMANQKLNSANPSSTGTLTHRAGSLGPGAGGALVPLDVLASTGNDDRLRCYVYRFRDGNGWDKCSWTLRREVDGSAQGSIEFGQPAAGSALSLGDGSGFSVKIGAGGNMNVPGNIVAGGTVSWSDESLKTHIEQRAVTRGMALALANVWSEWDFVETKSHDVGVTAQQARRVCPHYVFEVDYTPKGKRDTDGFFTTPDAVKKLGIDKPGMALEASMDNALAIEELREKLAEAMARIAQLET